jgi:hypothetical protein
MIDWESFVSRRNINFEEFKKEHNIATKEDLVNCCSRFGIEPPGQGQLNALFPEKQVEIKPVEMFEQVDIKKTRGAKK